MGLQIRCYVNGNQEFIDLYGNEKIDMEISFAEVQDITKKNSAFTKEFKVPGTKITIIYSTIFLISIQFI